MFLESPYITGMDMGSCQLVTDLLWAVVYVTDLLRGNWCNGFWA